MGRLFPKVPQNIPQNNFEELGELFLFPKHFRVTWGTVPILQVPGHFGERFPKVPGNMSPWLQELTKVSNNLLLDSMTLSHFYHRFIKKNNDFFYKSAHE